MLSVSKAQNWHYYTETYCSKKISVLFMSLKSLPYLTIRNHADKLGPQPPTTNSLSLILSFVSYFLGEIEGNQN